MKEYLGDSVYADCDGYSLILTTENGLPNDPSNHICLEPAVYEKLERYVAKLRDKAAASAKAEGMR